MSVGSLSKSTTIQLGLVVMLLGATGKGAYEAGKLNTRMGRVEEVLAQQADTQALMLDILQETKTQVRILQQRADDDRTRE